jgi:hypothetical protein
MAESKVVPIITMFIGAAFFAVAYFFMDIACTGWDFFNPVCQLGNISMMLFKFIIMVIGIVIFVVGLIDLFLDGFMKWLIIFIAMFIIMAVIFFIPGLDLLGEIFPAIMAIWSFAGMIGVHDTDMGNNTFKF